MSANKKTDLAVGTDEIQQLLHTIHLIWFNYSGSKAKIIFEDLLPLAGRQPVGAGDANAVDIV